MIGDGSNILFCYDLRNGVIPAQVYPEVFSFAKKPGVSFKEITLSHDFADHFNLSLSIQAH
jgi:hypothetical protein